MKTIQAITPNQVLEVYSGPSGCMCGCIGKYYVNPANRAEAEARRGYSCEDTDMNLGMVSKVLRILQNDPRTKLDDGILFVERREVGERNYVVYLK